MIPKEILIQAAKTKGLVNREHMEKDYFQDLLLFHIYKRTNSLVFKGGTCLHKLYGLPRFSEDLGFSVMGNSDFKGAIEDVVRSIKEAEIKETREIKNSLLVRIGFNGILTSHNTVRIDINLGNPLIEKFDVKNYTPPYVDINPFALRAMNLKEVVAEKIHSILAREKSRDLYDLFFLLRFVEVDKGVINRKLKNFDMESDYFYLAKRVSNLEGLWSKEMKPFILSDLPQFDVVKEFVLEKLRPRA